MKELAYNEILIQTNLAEKIYADLYQFKGTAVPLPGEMDFNFKIVVDKVDRYILKISRPHAIFEELEFRRLTTSFANTFSKQAMATKGTSNQPKETAIDSKKTPATAPSPKAGEGQFSLFGTDNEPATQTYSSRKTIKDTAHFYQTVQPGMGTRLFVENLMKQPSVCFDTETTGLNPLTAQLVGIAFSWEKGKGYYLPLPEQRDACQQIIEQLRPFFESTEIEKVGQNLKYDIKVLHKYRIAIQGKLFDTMLAHYLINPDMRHNMDILAETYLNYTPVSITELIGKKGKNQKSMRMSQKLNYYFFFFFWGSQIYLCGPFLGGGGKVNI